MLIWRIVTLLLTLGLLASMAQAAPDALAPPYGPLRLVNQHPMQLLFLQSFPDRADVSPPGQVHLGLNTALTNTLLVDQRGAGVTATIDLEMVRAVLELRYGLHPRLEVGVELPLLYTYDGILDTFILDTERVLTPNRERPIRKQQRAGQFVYQVQRGGDFFIQGQDDAFGPGDMVLKAKYALLPEGRYQPAVSLRAALKLPTGDKGQGFGSGAVDGSVGLLLQKSWWRLTVYLNADVTFPGPAFGEVDLSVQPFFLGVLSVEFRLSQSVSLVAQLRGDTRPFHGTIPLLDKRLIETDVGVNWAITRRLVLQAGVAEDQARSDCCSADVSFFLNLTGRL